MTSHLDRRQTWKGR